MENRSSSRAWFTCGAVIAAVLLCSACEPPGKPTLQEEARESGAPNYDFTTLYNQSCAGCHGVGGKNGAARILNDSLYLAFISREQLKAVLVNGRPGTAMPAWSEQAGGPLNDKQIDVLVNGIFGNWGKGADNLQPKPPAYEQPATGGDATHGKQLFARDCYMCHGKGAPIGSVTGGSYLALVSNQMIRTSIVVGRPDLGMPDYRFLNMGKPLSDGDLTDLVAYLSSMRPPPPASLPSSGPGGEGHMTKGNEGSGNGPGSPRKQKDEGNKGKGSDSQQGVK